MKQIIALGERSNCKIGCDENTGEILIRTPCKNYRNAFSIKVPLMYPEKGDLR